MNRTPARMLGGVGTVIAVVGAALLLLHLATKALAPEFRLTGALLVSVGVLLRVITAVWGSGAAPSRLRPDR